MKVVLIYSGGMDSTALLYSLRAEGHEVRCLSLDYGQRHGKKELGAAVRITVELGVEHRVVDLRTLRPLMKGSSQTDDLVPVPEGHYADESMKKTVVPNRNMIMLSIAAAWAFSTDSGWIAYAAHAGDHTIYPDCRPQFVEALEAALELADWKKVAIYRPFVHITKADIVRAGSALGVPWERTWSCYKGGAVHCGRCGTDVERKEAFRVAGIVDPTVYEDDTGAFRA